MTAVKVKTGENYRLEVKEVKPIQKGDLVEINGREWFDRINGNSYHCVYISINNQLVITCAFQYGYGDSYIQTASQALQNEGYYVNHDGNNMRMIDRYCRENEIHCVCHIERKCKNNQLPTRKDLGC
jgi:hypothetical protein